MYELYFRLQEEARPALRAGDLAACDRIFVDALRALPASPFHVAIDVDFRNPPEEVAGRFDELIRRESERFEVAAVYTETNGFTINPDRWYFDLFAFKAYGGHEDYDWLAEWDSQYIPDVTLIGMEDLQAVYASPATSDRGFDDASSVASLIVVSRFQQLIARSAPLMKQLRFPLLATAHDSEFIYEVPPELRRPGAAE